MRPANIQSFERQRRLATDLYSENSGQDVCGHFPFAFGAAGRTPSFEGSPKVFLRWDTEPFPRSCRPNSVASEASRISPTVFQPAAVTAVRIFVENRALSIGVSSGNSGAG